jgi:hypothetical protein
VRTWVPAEPAAKDEETPVGKPEVASVTAPEKPPKFIIVMVLAPLLP